MSEQETIVRPVGESGLERRNGAVGYEALVAEFLRAGSNQLIRGASLQVMGGGTEQDLGLGIQPEDVPLRIDDAQAFVERAEDGVERAAFVEGRSRVGRRKFPAFGLRVARVGRGGPGRAPHALPELLQEPTHCHDLSVRWCIMPPTVLTG